MMRKIPYWKCPQVFLIVLSALKGKVVVLVTHFKRGFISSCMLLPNPQGANLNEAFNEKKATTPNSEEAQELWHVNPEECC